MFIRGFKSWCETVAIQQRRELKLRSIDPIDPLLLAKHIGVKVWNAEDVPGLEPQYLKTLLIEDPDSWSAITLYILSTDLIILNSVHSPARRSSDLVHELSHILIGHEPSRVDISEDGLLMLNTYNKNQEDEANWLAGCLLLPRDALILIRQQGMDLKIAAKQYGVSQQMLRYRINVTGIEHQVKRLRVKKNS